MHLSLLLIIAFTFCIAADQVITPFGRRPAECVVTVPNDATVSEGPANTNTVKISHPSLGEYLHEVPPVCGADISSIKERARSRVNARDGDGWLDNAGWYPSAGQNNLLSFTSTYVVPGNPPQAAGQVLFYFIGMQDNDAPKAVNILQPVLTWGNGHQEWYVQSWACCPKNITVTSQPLFGLKPGSEVGGTIVRVSDSTWKIDSEFNGQHTILNAQVGDYIYNWADVTLETYSVKSCNQFASGKTLFTNLVLKDQQGQTLVPKWTLTGATQCSGSISQPSGTEIAIQHSTS